MTFIKCINQIVFKVRRKIMATTKHVKVSNGGLLKVVEAKVNCNYSAIDGVQIDKILDNVVNFSLTQTEKVNDLLNVSGRVNLRSIYLDTEKNLQTSDVSVDFSEKVQIPDADAVVVVPKVKSVKSHKETAVFVDTSIILDLEIYGVLQEVLTFIEAGSPELNELTEEISADNLLCYNSSVAENVESVDLEAGAEVKCVYSSLCVSKVLPNGNFVTISGEVMRDIIYTLNGNIKRIQKRSDVQEEVSLLNCTTNTPCFAKCFIASEKFDTETSETSTTLNISTELSVSIWGFERVTFTVLKDAYSCNKNINLTTTSFEALKYGTTMSSSDQISVVEDVSTAKRIDEVLGLGSNIVKINSTSFSDGMFIVSGNIAQTVLCKNYDNDDIFSTVLNSEFQTTISNLENIDSQDLDYSVEARCISYKNKAGKEIALNYEINTLYNAKTCKSEYLVKEIEETEKTEVSPYSIFVYKPEPTEKVFDIAKKLCVTPDCVLSQNPEIEDGKPISRVVVYKRMQKAK